MKKTLIALAALAATGAFAQNVTLTGVIDAGVKSTSLYQGGSQNTVTNNGTATSQIDFVGTEDLGGGMMAKFFFEWDINPTTSTTLDSSTASSSAYYSGTPFQGQQYLGLTGGFGEVLVGSPNAAFLDNNGQTQPFGTAMGSGYSTAFGRMSGNALGVSQYAAAGGTNSGRIIRHEKVVKYVTPNFAGFKASLEYSFGYQTDGNGANANQNNRANDQYTALGMTYSKGPLNLVYAYGKDYSGPAGSQYNVMSAAATSALAADSAVVFHQFGGNYNFGALTTYAGYTKTKTDNETGTLGLVEDGSSWNVAGKYAVAPAIDVMANYVVRNSAVNSNTAQINNAKLFGLGADYKLSKRTTVYYRYEAMDTNTDGKTITTGSSATIANMVGIRHAF
jgi:predicted porin